MQTNMALNTLLAESLAQLRTHMFVIGKLTEADGGVRNMPSTNTIDLHFERFSRVFKQRLCGIAPDAPGAPTTSMPTGAAPLRPRPPSMVQRPAGHGGASVPAAGASTARGHDGYDPSLLMPGEHTAADPRHGATNTERAGGGAAGTSAMAQGGGGGAVIVGYPPSRAVSSVRLDPGQPPLRAGDRGQQAAEQDVGATTLNRKKFIALSNALLGYGPPGT